MQFTEDKIVLYQNRLGSVYQNDSKNVLLLDINGIVTPLNLPCFFCLKKAIDKVDLQKMADNLETDVEIVNPCSCDRCFVLNLQEAYLFQDLLAGAKAMLELNSILHERLFSFELI